MKNLLTAGDFVIGELSRAHYHVEAPLGEGGQGQVFRVRSGERCYALKWYALSYLNVDIGLQDRLKRLVQRGAPSEHFLFPLELVSSSRQSGFGYVMEIRPAQFHILTRLLTGAIQAGFAESILSCIDMCKAFLHLHADGFSYKDINARNFFIDPDNGKILICDNDNIDVNGRAGVVRGTMIYMAPEIIANGQHPNAETDLHSLSVLMFRILFFGHPLDNDTRHITEDAEVDLFGNNPLFVLHPTDKRNYYPPKHQVNRFWSIYPTCLRELFTRTFVEGLKNPRRRVRENEWLRALRETLRSTVQCDHCGAENIVDQGTQAPVLQCWSCHAPVRPQTRIRLNQLEYVGGVGATIYAHDLGNDNKLDFSKWYAKVVRHPTKPHLIGLNNCSADTWMATFNSGKVESVPPGTSLRLAGGTKLDFGNGVGAEIFPAFD